VIAEAPMKAEPGLGLALPWPRITAAFLLEVAVLALASHFPRAPHTDRPTGSEHGTWLLLRMDPQHNVAAVAARDSVASTRRWPPSGSPAIGRTALRGPAFDRR
jgi:hypothetical protein